ncbi:hypothetical protein MMC12_006132 [Toensbergia leucococca]|nr:hypothetical protein [Toensbergia leucococca]
MPLTSGEPAKKKKKKNAPDKSQPASMFPPNEDNLVLNPKPVSDAPKRKEKEEKDGAIDFLKHKALSIPMKSAPPSQLLTLVGAFLTSYGFDSASHLFASEREARKKLHGWNDEIGKRLEADLPDLVKIYKEWYKEREGRRPLEMTSSDEENGAATKRVKKAKKEQKLDSVKVASKGKETSTSGTSDSSNSDSSSDVEMKDAVPSIEASKKTNKTAFSSSSSSKSDSDADDEKEAFTAKSPSPKPVVNNLKQRTGLTKPSSPPPNAVPLPGSNMSSSEDDESPPKKLSKSKKSEATKPPIKVVTTAPVKGQKKKKASTGSSSSDSTSASESEPELSTAKKTLPASSPSSSSSSSSSDAAPPPAPKSKKPLTKKSKPSKEPRKTSTDSSATLDPVSNPKSSAITSASVTTTSTSFSTSSSSLETPAPTKKPTTKRKRSPSPAPQTPAQKVPKQRAEPFSRVPADTKVDAKLASNKYVPYDYAERAHKDLVVTKGKGFTKEKNKKKRGSYRGGAIDVEGKKGIKFDD